MRICFNLLFIFLCVSGFTSHAQSMLSGKIVDRKTGKPLENVNIFIKDIDKGDVTNASGEYDIDNIPNGEYIVKATYVGYETAQRKITMDGSNVKWNVEMEIYMTAMNEVVVTATRNEQLIKNIPSKVHALPMEELQSIPMHTIDDAFRLASGVNVDRPYGIFSSKAIVTMRGLSGNEQGRTLVLFDGIPVNKSDGGTVNFHLIENMGVERVEILKGPASALYGGNAMGGVINIISSKPKKPFEPFAYAKYGTFNTLETGAMIRGREEAGSNYFYWGVNGHYTESDGYVTEPPIEQTEYTVPAFLNEKNVGATFGYSIKEKQNIELQLQVYDDERGSGEQVIEEKGSFSEHDSYHSRLNYHANWGKTKLKSSIFFLQENYKKVNEYMKSGEYTLYDVDSRRRDMGLLLHATRKYFKKHELTVGIDAKQGSVVAADIYYTSTDKINNQGYMNFAAAFIQDAYDVSEKLKLVAGLRFDYAGFYNGKFTVENPSAKVEYMQLYEAEDLGEHDWNAVTTKLSAQYAVNKNIRTYLSYGEGFRPPILDDMCRSGKTRGGFQVANPNLKPERLQNFELGADIILLNKVQISPAAYFSIGKDFMYFVTNGDTVDMGYPAPVLNSENVSRVEIYGFEMDLNYKIIKGLNFKANYAYAHSQVKEYTPSIEQMTDIEGKFLVRVPEHLAYAGLSWKNEIVNLGCSANYMGESYRRDDNLADEKYGVPATYPDVITLDAKLWKTFKNYITIGLSVQNIFDEKYTDRKAQLSPGRFIMYELKFKM